MLHQFADGVSYQSLHMTSIESELKKITENGKQACLEIMCHIGKRRKSVPMFEKYISCLFRSRKTVPMSLQSKFAAIITTQNGSSHTIGGPLNSVQPREVQFTCPVLDRLSSRLRCIV
jgi:hypothetical protein